MDIKRNGSQPSSKGPAEWFTGNIRIDVLFQPNDSRHANASSVTFELAVLQSGMHRVRG